MSYFRTYSSSKRSRDSLASAKGWGLTRWMEALGGKSLVERDRIIFKETSPGCNQLLWMGWKNVEK
ncbi:MAG: hypothetical protein ACR2NK_07665 [Mariniblastus sp.]